MAHVRYHLVTTFPYYLFNFLEMKKQLTLIYGIVLLLTIVTAILSKFSVHKTAAISILALSGVKFLLVAFHFMELKKANVFWKATLSLFLVLLIGIISLII